MGRGYTTDILLALSLCRIVVMFFTMKNDRLPFVAGTRHSTNCLPLTDYLTYLKEQISTK
jgi:hypothetical protein